MNSPFYRSPASLLKTAALGAVIIALYGEALRYLFSRWEVEDYNYCYLIPFIVFYLVWEKRRTLSTLPSIPDWKGILPFFLGVMLFWIGELGGEYYTLWISLWIVTTGLLWWHIGIGKLREVTFPIFFSLSLFPFPNLIHNQFSLQLRLISSRIGVAMLQLYGLPAYREGNIIDLGFVELQVVDACNGLRYLFPLLILSLIVAYFSKTAYWKRILLVLSTIPLSIITNSLRIALTGIIYKYWGAEYAEGFFHGFSGWLIFIICLIILVGEVWVLKKIPSRSESPIAAKKSREGRTAANDNPKHRNFPAHFIVPLVILVLTLFFSSKVEFQEKIPTVKSFREFPLSIGDWKGRFQPIDQATIDVLHFSDYINIDWVNQAGSAINFYTAYYESQRKGASIHSPETCIPGSGWVFTRMGIKTISYDTADNEKIKVNVALIQKNNAKQVVYYWFPQRGRNLTNAYQLKIYTFWDALTKQRTDGALVRLITPLREGEKVKDGENRLQSFMGAMMPVLNDFLPE